MKNEYDNQKRESKQLLLGVWVIGENLIDEKEVGKKGLIESVFEEIEDELNEYIAEGVSDGVWIIKVDESNQWIMKIKDKLKEIFNT